MGQRVTPAVVNPPFVTLYAAIVLVEQRAWNTLTSSIIVTMGVRGCHPRENFEISYWKWCIVLHSERCNNSSQSINLLYCVLKNVILIFFPDHINSLTFPWLEQIFSIFPDFSLTILKFPDISRFPAFPDKVVTLDKFSYIPHVLVMWRQYCWLLALAKFSTVFLV